MPGFSSILLRLITFPGWRLERFEIASELKKLSVLVLGVRCPWKSCWRHELEDAVRALGKG